MIVDQLVGGLCSVIRLLLSLVGIVLSALPAPTAVTDGFSWLGQSVSWLLSFFDASSAASLRLIIAWPLNVFLLLLPWILIKSYLAKRRPAETLAAPASSV